MDESDKRELANYLDGEGFIGIVSSRQAHRKIRFIPIMILTNNNRPWLDNVRDKGGGTVSPGANHDHNPKHKPNWQWHIHGGDLLQVLSAVRPYLKIKGEASDLCRELQYRISQRVGIDQFGRLIPQEREYRAELHRKCKLLTSRGLPQ